MLQMFLTDDGEVEGGLSEAVAVPQLDGVTPTVILLTAGDGQFTAAVSALYGDVSWALLDLTTHKTCDTTCENRETITQSNKL